MKIEVPGLFTPQREFILHNATDDPIILAYDGDSKEVPPFDKVVLPHPKYPDVSCSARDADGDFIPGTLVIRDVVENRHANADDGITNARGDRWDAAAAIRHCLGIDPTTREANSMWYKRGISLLPANPTKDVVRQVASEGRARFEEFRLANDRETVNGYHERASKHRALGLHPQPPPAEFYAAEARLNAFYAKSGIPNGPAPDTTELLEFGKSLARQVALDVAKEQPGLDVGTIIDKLVEDPRFMDAVKAKFQQKATTKRAN